MQRLYKPPFEFHRHNQSLFGHWWRSVDRITLAIVISIMGFSALMVAAASPAVAERIGVESFYFIRRQLVFLVVSMVVMINISLVSPVTVRRLSILGYIFGLGCLVLVLLAGMEAKGARRWLSVGGLSLQPSEFIKPFFAVTTAWILSQKYQKPHFPSFSLAFGLYGILVLLLILQPDFGMTATISIVWGGQLFLAGLPLLWIGIAVIMGIIGITGAYLFLPHVTERINNFLDPSSEENYQVKRSLEAFMSGGIYGKGPGEGVVKQVLPDSHTDFIFAVVGEEFGLVACIIIIMLYGIIVLRGFLRALQDKDLFILYAVAGLIMQFGMQALFNIGVTLHLLPTKGMTLPFISYGGSSLLSVSLTMGMILALTRRRYGIVKTRRGYWHNARRTS